MGTGYTYQWLKNNVNIANATNVLYTAKTSGGYRVRVDNPTACFNLSATKTISVPCREEELLNADEVVVFPNPFNDEFTITTTDANAIGSLSVFDITGKLIEQDLHLSYGKHLGTNWSKGVYLIEITNGDNHQYLRVIKI